MTENLLDLCRTSAFKMTTEDCGYALISQRKRFPNLNPTLRSSNTSKRVLCLGIHVLPCLPSFFSLRSYLRS